MPNLTLIATLLILIPACALADDLPLLHLSTMAVDDSAWPRFNMASFDQDKIDRKSVV